MKKLMFAAAVAAGFAAFGEGIESANTVGYGQSDLRNGATMVTPQFAPMSGNTISLDSLVPTGENLSDNVSLMLLDVPLTVAPIHGMTGLQMNLAGRMRILKKLKASHSRRAKVFGCMAKPPRKVCVPVGRLVSLM